MSISNVTGVKTDISQMLQKIREASGKQPAIATGSVQAKSESNFSQVVSDVKKTFNSVNELQANTESLKNAYISGDPNVSISQVVVASEKSKLAFEGLVVVRNKLLDAYKEIMNMPV